MFNSVLLGITNYYSFALNFADLNRIQYILKFSAAKTLATKHRSTVNKVFAKYGNGLTVKRSAGKVIYLKLIKDWRMNSLRFMIGAETPDIYLKQWKMRTRSKLGLDCVICGNWEDVQMHHTRAIRKMGQKVIGFDRILLAINRKQLPVCVKCHTAIHKGIYDGIALSSFVNPYSAAA